jgi:hypothetical protein
LDYLDFIFKSIHYHTAKIPESTSLTPNLTTHSKTEIIQIDDKSKFEFKYSCLSPPIILVGTNKNGLNNMPNKNELIREKFHKIKEFISNKIYLNHVIEPYFAIDNLSSNSSLNKNGNYLNISENNEGFDQSISNEIEIENLKRVIEMVSLNETYMGEQLPLKWMKFEKSLENLKNKGLFYASLSQICEIAHEKDIKTQEELTTCLNFLNDLGTIIYYGNANDIFLRNTIILRPQKLVEIFNMVLDAKMPSSFIKSQSENPSELSPSHNSSNKWLDMWEKFNKNGILTDSLLDVLWKSVINQKPGLLGLMKKFDLICDRNVTVKLSTALSNENIEREYLVPSRAKINYDEDFEEEMQNKLSSKKSKKKRKKKNSDFYLDNDYDDYEEDHSDSMSSFSSSSSASEYEHDRTTSRLDSKLNENSIAMVEFFYDFCGFLPGKLILRFKGKNRKETI